MSGTPVHSTLWGASARWGEPEEAKPLQGDTPTHPAWRSDPSSSPSQRLKQASPEQEGNRESWEYSPQLSHPFCLKGIVRTLSVSSARKEMLWDYA